MSTALSCEFEALASGRVGANLKGWAEAALHMAVTDPDHVLPADFSLADALRSSHFLEWATSM